MWGGGSGATCETDQHGRPISIAFWNSLSLRDTLLALTQSGMSEGEKKNFFRGFSTHEINHGLGFNIGAFLASDIVYRKDVCVQASAKRRRCCVGPIVNPPPPLRTQVLVAAEHGHERRFPVALYHQH
jgi:hypothetical protein